MHRSKLLIAACLALSCGPDTGGRERRDGGGGGGDSGGTDDAYVACVGLECQVKHDCVGGAHTTLTGYAYAPNGTLPLYNATVFIPNAPLDTFTSGVTCDACDGKVSGNPIAIAQSDASGAFTLVDVPSGTNIPLVVQVGRWRRQVMLPVVPECATTPLISADDTRLPKNKTEGDIPQIAMVTGSSDPFECMFKKLGIDDNEVTIPSQTGRVHYFVENGTDIANGNAPAGNTLYNDPNALARYDIVVLACEGSPVAKPAPALANMVNYLNAGGRVFATHYSYTWLTYTNSPFSAIGTWHPDQSYPADGLIGTLDQSFPKGQAFAQWLKNVETGSTLGQMAITAPRHDFDTVNPMYAQQWITATDGHKITEHMTVNMPLSPQLDPMGKPMYCGRAVFSDFHVSATAAQPGEYPNSCKNEKMTQQEKALAFMLFDLSNCVQKDTEPPIP